jgi:Zn-dependent protease
MLQGQAFIGVLIFGPISILLAFGIHEFFHAYSANLMGDPTARYQGRMTLNPVAHFDRIGTPLLLITYVFSMFNSGIGCFGWGKPVPINPYNFRDPRSGTLVSSLAGPMSNFAAALLAGIFFGQQQPLFVHIFLQYFIMINIWLGVFNLIPLPPLDGWKILTSLLPPGIGYRLQAMESQYAMIGLIIIIFLFPTGILGSIAGALFRIFTRT